MSNNIEIKIEPTIILDKPVPSIPNFSVPIIEKKADIENINIKQKNISRSNITRRDLDKIPNFSINIKDIDFTIKYYVQNVIKPKVVENNRILDVPVIYGNPERWKSIQKDGYFRDERDKIILPIIIYKRNSISKDENISIDKLDANKPNLFYNFKKKYSEKNRYSRFSILNNEIPVNEFYSVVVPDYIVINYEFIILTESNEQMNKIIEAILYSEGSYWGEKDRFKFRTKINSFENAIEISSDTIRTVKTTFNLEINGYLLQDSINKELALNSGNFVKQFSTKQVLFKFEDSISSLEDLSKINVNSQKSPAGGTTEIRYKVPPIDYIILDYINTNKSLVGTIINDNSVIFENVKIYDLSSSYGINVKEDFKFFINGQFINKEFLSYFENDGNNVKITFDMVNLYGAGSALTLNNDIVVGIGKFK